MRIEKASINRAQLLATCNMLKPALSTQAFIPALQHILFRDGYAMAYNDVMAARVKTNLGLDGVCVPGDLLIRALSSFKGETVVISDDGAGGILVASGKSKMKVPCLPVEQYPFQFPALQEPFADITPSFLKGLERCLGAVGSDPTHPAQQGITLEASAGGTAAELYSTDNFTISHYTAKDANVELPGDVPVILPTAFATYLVSLHKQLGGNVAGFLVEVTGGVAAELGPNVAVFSKGLIDLDPLDFGAVMGKHTAGATEGPQPFPPGLEEALGRAMLVLGSEPDKITTFGIGKTSLTLHTSTTVGQADDILVYDADIERTVKIDPALVLRGIKNTSEMEFLPGALMLTEGEVFSHMVSYCN